MGRLALLEEARAAGLTVYAVGDVVEIRGPQRAAALAKVLLRRKEEVLAALARESASDWPTIGQVETWLGRQKPVGSGSTTAVTDACASCFSPRWWRRRGADSEMPWICARCHPPQAGDESDLEVRIVPDGEEHDHG